MRTTTLKFFRNEDNNYGIMQYAEMPFQTFYKSPMSIFHGVFESYFVGHHAYFMGDYAFNLGSLIAAMGHHYYYMYTLAPEKINYLSGEEVEAYQNAIINISNYDLLAAINNGRLSYGARFLSKVPRQETNKAIDPFIRKHWMMLKYRDLDKLDPETREVAILYRQSLTMAKFKALYRWGYRQAEQIVPKNRRNLEVINQFYTACQKITSYDPKLLFSNYDGMQFDVWEGEKLRVEIRFVSKTGALVPYK